MIAVAPLAAQQNFRLKTVRSSFQAMFWITATLNLRLVTSGMAETLARPIGR